jgi:hypothetical protein
MQASGPTVQPSSWANLQWLRDFQLNHATAMAYFALSPFYDSTQPLVPRFLARSFLGAWSL